MNQHIAAKKSCQDAQQISLGMAVDEPPPRPVIRPVVAPNSAPGAPIQPAIPTIAAARRPDQVETAARSMPSARKRLPGPVDFPASKVAHRPNSSQGELEMMQNELDQHPDRSLEEWRQMADEFARFPEALGKSTRSARKSISVATSLAGIAGKQMQEEAGYDMLDDDSHEDDMAMDEDDNHLEEEEGKFDEGTPLNEHVVAGEDDFNNDGFLNINVDTKMRDQFKQYCAKAEANMYPQLTVEQERAVKLLDIMRKKHTSLDTYEDLMKWHLCELGVLDEGDNLKAAGDHYISRDKLLSDLAVRYNMEKKLPYVKPVKLPHSGQNLDLVCHDAYGCIESLLTDPRLTDDDFWFFGNDPFGDPPESVDTITDLHTGMAYREAHKQYKKKPNQIPLPVPLYLDGANTGQMKNMPITALKMTLGIFTRKYRDLDQAWRVLGHVHHVSKNQARAQKIFKMSKHVDAGLQVDQDGQDEKLPKDIAGPSKDLHKMLDIILESFREVQKTGFKWDLRYRGTTYDVEFVPFVIFMKCDTQEGDVLCGSYTTRTGNVSQLCRYCTCPTKDTDNPQAKYDFKTVPMVKAYVDANDMEALKDLSQHCFDNAFYKIRFSPINHRGIHGATPSEMLHAILLGTFQMLRDVLFEQIGDDSKCSRVFQALAMLFGKLFGRQSERGVPKCSFNSGIKEGKLNAKEYRGILLVMAAVFRSSAGRKALMDHGFTRQKIQDWLELLEIVLAWEAYLNEPAMTRVHVARLSMKHRYLMWMIKKVADRKTGMGLKLMKFHAITHLAFDILLYGVPLEVDTGSNESGHKATKHAARSTQKNEKTFDIQTATRLSQHHVLDMAMEEIRGRKLWRYYTKSETTLPDSPEPPEVIVTGGTQFNIFESENGKPCFSIGVGSQAKVPARAEWDADVVKFLHACQEKLRSWSKSKDYKLQIYSDHTRNGQIFRGHPLYRGDNPWRDWVLVQWGDGEPEPAQIWCFIDLNNIVEPEGESEKLVFGNCDLTHGVFAVIEAAEYRARQNGDPRSHFFRPMVKEMGAHGTGGVRSRKFYLIDTEAIADPCFVIPDVGSQNGKSYFQVKNREEWVHVFEDWLVAPNPPAYMNDKEGKNL